MKTYGDYLSKIFPDFKVQKISINAGFTCPNRDGTIGKGGCIYCRNDSFSPGYCNSNDSVTKQLKKGKEFFSRKYPEMKFLAYFQSYTGTYGFNIENLSRLYTEALQDPHVVGLVIATRPDCINDETIGLLSEINSQYHVFMEIGAETSFDSTLRLINRNHKWEDVESSIIKLSDNGLRCGIHLIAGLPGESDEMIIETVRKSCRLPIQTLKLHQLQILYGTPLYQLWKDEKIKIREYSVDEYLKLCARIVELVPEDIIIERFLSQSPPELVASPKWGLKNYQFVCKLATLLKNHHSKI